MEININILHAVCYGFVADNLEFSINESDLCGEDALHNVSMLRMMAFYERHVLCTLN